MIAVVLWNCRVDDTTKWHHNPEGFENHLPCRAADPKPEFGSFRSLADEGWLVAGFASSYTA